MISKIYWCWLAVMGAGLLWGVLVTGRGVAKTDDATSLYLFLIPAGLLAAGAVVAALLSAIVYFSRSTVVISICLGLLVVVGVATVPLGLLGAYSIQDKAPAR